jgi:ABC-type amino acid transport system permease subunit
MFWYAVVIHFPPPRLAHQFASAVFLSNRGLYIPKFEHSFLLLAFFLLGTVFCIVAFLSYRALKSVGGAWSAVTIPSVIATVIAGTCALMLFFANASAFSVSWPTLTGLNFRGGMQIPPEFTALIAAIVIYRGAFISEVFRAGLSAVGRGQIDAAKSLGLKPWVVLLTIRFPLALISIIPPLSNEFIIIMKITSIGIVVGFYDLFAVTSQAALLTGRALEALLMMMVIYLILNYVMVGIMNFANHRVRARGFVFNG